MITYLLSATLLSWIGWVAYVLFIRSKASLQQEKQFIYLVLLGSLLSPIFIGSNESPKEATEVYVTPLAFGSEKEHAHIQQYCKCEQPDYTHRITYRTNAFYNFLVNHKHWMVIAIFLGIAAVLIKSLLQLKYIHRLVKTSKKELRAVDGISFTLLKTQRPHAIGAFQLFRPYIIWQSDMESLNPLEIQAIFRHEISHLRQYNTLEKTILNLIQCLWFLNPAFYYFRKELALLSECIADNEGASIMKNRKSYAQLLIKVKELQLVGGINYFKGSVLHQRVFRLLNHKPSNGKAYIPLAYFLIILFQIGITHSVKAQISGTLRDLQTYEVIYHQINSNTEEVLYCRDCETVCTMEPEENVEENELGN